MIHMASTGQRNDGQWTWQCRCGRESRPFRTREAVRRDGEQHLVEANALKGTR